MGGKPPVEKDVVDDGNAPIVVVHGSRRNLRKRTLIQKIFDDDEIVANKSLLDSRRRREFTAMRFGL
jgi:hypothetical protein